VIIVVYWQQMTVICVQFFFQVKKNEVLFMSFYVYRERKSEKIPALQGYFMRLNFFLCIKVNCKKKKPFCWILNIIGI
jgi:hypothetical protein